MAIDTSQNDYYFGYTTLVRPNMKRIQDVWARWSTVRWNRKRYTDAEQFSRGCNYARDLVEGKVRLTEDERQETKAWCPEAWWQVWGNPRCPGCGKQGRPVGVTFEASQKQDKKAWSRLEEVMTCGQKYDWSRCRKARWEANMEKHRRYLATQEQQYTEARQSRMRELHEVLKQSRQTDSEEERKLAVIRTIREEKSSR
ncbi:hypothetical protein BDY19DRAFT_205416 [Irpex rosettiformis]|uniref:Uncharacterized protein n=1 Tax=Irpex rosettiformis TaxID=378272 RepID=A0ACB8U1E5_9APHY|nr:hypothetical protein BDY19DRAFT_205416 [Irpex rosettiformis]